jgi:hypothetical protein
VNIKKNQNGKSAAFFLNCKKMKKLKVIILILFICLLTLFLSIYIWFAVTPFSEKNIPTLKNGDLVFQTIQGSQTLAIMFASQSVYSHIGMIHIKNGKPNVMEAIGPVREIPLDKWVKQGIGDRLSIMRIKDLDEAAADKAIKAAGKYLGLPYDFFFLMGNDQIYCSELVYKAFKEGDHIQLGKVENVSDLNINNFAVDKIIKERWKKHPLCSNISDYDTCYKTIMSQKLVTPASIAEDKNVELIYTNYK